MESGLDHFSLWTGLIGGLALFLFGMDQLTKALKVVAGDKMKYVLAKLTANRFAGVATGAAVTAIIQSSSVTTVILVGFISAGLLSLTQAVPVIMGANIGTTITAQVLAFKVTKISLPLIAVGFGVLFLSKNDRIKHLGSMVMGLGMVFYGMTVMSGGMAPLRSHQPFLDLMAALDSTVLAVLIGAVFTALVQSSSATTGIVIVLAGQGLVGLPISIGLIFGANIGTCVTAGLASIGKPREAVRAAVVHVIFNVAGVLIFIGFIPYLADFVTSFSPTAKGLTGNAKAMAETPRQVANAHTIFNIANTLILIWFAPLMSRAAMKIIPHKVEPKPEVIEPKYLDEGLLETPSLALEMARLETARLGKIVRSMHRVMLPAVISGTLEDLDKVEAMDGDVDILHEAIIHYLSQINESDLPSDDQEGVVHLIEAVHGLEHIGDVIETNMVQVGRRRIEEKVVVSEKTAEQIFGYHAQVGRALKAVVKAIKDNNPAKAKRVRDLKTDMEAQAKAAVGHQLARLRTSAPNRLHTFRREMEILENLRHIFRICRRVASAYIGPEEEPVPAEKMKKNGKKKGQKKHKS